MAKWWIAALGVTLAIGAVAGWALWSRGSERPGGPIDAPLKDAGAPALDAAALAPTADAGEVAADAWGEQKWPLYTYGLVPTDRSLLVPEAIASVALSPMGDEAYLTVPEAKDPSATLRRWRFDQGTEVIPIEGKALEVVASGFDGALYVLAQSGQEWRLNFLPRQAGGLGPAELRYRSPTSLSALVCPTVRWNGEERCFFASEHAPGRHQILSVRRTGLAPYEVTSPSGALGERTDPNLRVRTDPEMSPPAVAQVDSATPLSVDPVAGTLLYAAGGRVYERPYVDQNWESPRPRTAWANARLLYSPNGELLLRYSLGKSDVTLVRPDGQVLERVETKAPLLTPPAIAANGRAVLGVVLRRGGSELHTYALTSPLAKVRFLTHVPPNVQGALAAQGYAAHDTKDTQLYQEYERRAYDVEAPVPVYAAIDGMLEVLGAGFQAVFMLAERDLSRPKLLALLAALETAAQAGAPRVAQIAKVTAKMLAGDFDHDEGRLVLAEQPAPSTLHTVPKAEPIDFADFHPRGSYTTSPELMSYFRAFKYLNLLALTEAERRVLAADPQVVAALDAWTAVQAPFVWPARRKEDLLGRAVALPPYVRPDCLPTRILEAPVHPFPLAFGIDAEILESTVSRLGVAADCSTKNEEPYRKLPTGLDLLTGLGSDEARRRSAPEYREHPELAAVHAQLAARFGRAVDDPQLQGPRGAFAQSWLRLVQLLANPTLVPEGVAPERWRGRLLETALATWVSLRHTTILVSEGTGAEMGGAWFGFELFESEPIRGAVDPLPDAWTHLGKMLRTLESLARPIDPGVARELADAAQNTERFGRLALRQSRGEPLSEEDYQAIASYGQAIEHPFLKLQAALHPLEGLAGPDPMMKIVDVQRWQVPGETRIWHVAIGRPQAVVVLLPDRGLLVPAHGALYRYHEVIADRPLDDAAFRAEVDRTPRPPWLPPIETSTRP